MGAVDRVVAAPAAGPAFALRAAARPSRRSRSRDGLLPVQQRRRGRGARPRTPASARVAIVDFDVHHGNGTQAAFYDDPSVLFVSSHQYPVLPGHRRGHRDRDAARGAGFTVNLPLEAGAGDADLDEAYRRGGACRCSTSSRRELLLVSAGFDAHADDPLAALRMSPAGFANLARLLMGVAARHAGGRIVVRDRGRLRPRRRSTTSLARGAGGGAPATVATTPVAGDRSRGRRAVAAARAALGRVLAAGRLRPRSDSRLTARIS